jgi:Flp pilus assembly protein TadG
MRLPRWVFGGVERRGSPRFRPGALTAAYWGGSANPKPVREVSMHGAVIEAADEWYEGTLLRVVLTDGEDRGVAPRGSASCGVWSRVLRRTGEGICVQFVFPSVTERLDLQRFLERVKRGESVKTEDAKRGSEGQALLEFALVLPLLFLLIVNVINFAGMLYAFITVANAARTGAQYYATGGATIGGPAQPAPAVVQSLVLQDLVSLPNAAAAQVHVCERTAAATTCVGPGSGSPPLDTETVPYTTLSVDVRYTYTPFIPLFEFPALKIHATLPPTAIHRQSVMRVLN